jgi:hypothetical protein
MKKIIKIWVETYNQKLLIIYLGINQETKSKNNQLKIPKIYQIMLKN